MAEEKNPAESSLSEETQKRNTPNGMKLVPDGDEKINHP